MTLQAKLLVLGLIALTAFVSGIKVATWRYDAEKKKQLEETIALREAYDIVSRDLVKQYNSVKAEKEIIYREIRKEIPNVTDDRICFADANALSLWNSALNGLPQASTGTPDQTAGTDSATDAEVLENAVENFKQYTQVRDQLNKLIDFHEKVWTK